MGEREKREREIMDRWEIEKSEGGMDDGCTGEYMYVSCITYIYIVGVCDSVFSPVFCNSVAHESDKVIITS